jgi:hypothetical protein
LNQKLLLIVNGKLNVAKKQQPKPLPPLLEAKSHFLPMHPLYLQHTLLRNPVLYAATSPHAFRSPNPD